MGEGIVSWVEVLLSRTWEGKCVCVWGELIDKARKCPAIALKSSRGG